MVNNAIEDKDETGREVEMEKQWGEKKNSTDGTECFVNAALTCSSSLPAIDV